MIKILTVCWLSFMLWLSHSSGQTSGEQNRWMSSVTGVNEGVLRQLAHVVVYIILGGLVTVGWTEAQLWMRAAALLFIATVDETSKALPFFPGRHCSVWPDMVLNLVGAGMGMGLGVMMQRIL